MDALRRDECNRCQVVRISWMKAVVVEPKVSWSQVLRIEVVCYRDYRNFWQLSKISPYVPTPPPQPRTLHSDLASRYLLIILIMGKTRSYFYFLLSSRDPPGVARSAKKIWEEITNKILVINHFLGRAFLLHVSILTATSQFPTYTLLNRDVQVGRQNQKFQNERNQDFFSIFKVWFLKSKKKKTYYNIER